MLDQDKSFYLIALSILITCLLDYVMFLGILNKWLNHVTLLTQTKRFFLYLPPPIDPTSFFTQNYRINIYYYSSVSDVF